MSYNTYQSEEVRESIPMMTRQWLNNYDALSNKTTIAVQEAGSNRGKANGILEEVEEEIPILSTELKSANVHRPYSFDFDILLRK